MNCQAFADQLDEYLEGALADPGYDAAAAHLQRCAACQRRVARAQALRAALRTLPAPAPRSGFFEQALARAQRPHDGRRMGWAYVTGAALAASLALWIGAGSLPVGMHTPTTKPIGVTIALHETRTVQLAFNAERDLPQATLRITLPAGVELKGFPGQRQVSWQTNIARGANLLSLPLIAVATTDGALLARLEHGDRSTELVVPLHVGDAAHTSGLSSTSTVIGEREPLLKEVTRAKG
jgi:anti-sigma factor RsiW